MNRKQRNILKQRAKRLKGQRQRYTRKKPTPAGEISGLPAGYILGVALGTFFLGLIPDDVKTELRTKVFSKAKLMPETLPKNGSNADK